MLAAAGGNFLIAVRATSFLHTRWLCWKIILGLSRASKASTSDR
jgi:hypothetical protein